MSGPLRAVVPAYLLCVGDWVYAPRHGVVTAVRVHPGLGVEVWLGDFGPVHNVPYDAEFTVRPDNGKAVL